MKLRIAFAWVGPIAASVLVSVLFSSLAEATTVSARRIAAARRLIPLQKITIGPDDQYQGVVTPDGKKIVFTRKADLAPRLCVQDLKSGQVKDLLSVTADSQEAAFNRKGELAFTYFKFRAQGDICIKKSGAKVQGDDSGISCLATRATPAAREGKASMPFWRSERELGFLFFDPQTDQSQILVTNLDSNATEVLAQGKIWHPVMREGGRFLLYRELVGTRQVLRIRDLTAGTVSTVEIDLSGIPGFAEISSSSDQGEQFLYFSHYLNDTNGDGVIDGNDNAIIMRAPLSAAASGRPVFPEQLTSVDTNCSFPHVSGNDLFVTCAFEGSLDLYRLPSSGIVPRDWGRETLLNAHQTARSYGERILLLNTLRFRTGESTPEQDGRVFSDHWLSDDMAASRYYLERLRSKASGEKLKSLKLIGLLIEARDLKRVQPVGEVTRAFQAAIEKIGESARNLGGSKRLSLLVDGFLRLYLKREAQSVRLLREVRFDTPADPFELLLYYQLATTVYSSQKLPADLLKAYGSLIRAKELSEEARIYYAFNLLKTVAEQRPEGGARLKAIESLIQPGLPAEVSQLLQAERAVLRVITASGSDAKAAAYKDLDLLMSATRSDYFLRKALYVRAILNFSDAQEFKYLNFVATNWLRYTAQGDTEFIYAREVVGEAALDRAYDTLSKHQVRLAENYFYGSLSLTDDLEAHAGFIRALIAQKQRPAVDERYRTLVQKGQIDDNMNYVEALLAVLDAEEFDRAISSLGRMEQDRDSPVRYLLLGYSYLEKLLRTAKGYDFDPKLAEEANRNLILANELGRDNVRVRAAALINLGLLHQRIGNHGLAARYLAMRQEIDSRLSGLSPEVRLREAAIFARSLYYSNQPERAVEVLNAALPLASNEPQRLLLLERLAFYQLAAGADAEAAATYAKFFAEKSAVPGLDPGRQAKSKLGYGFVLFRLKRADEARSTLREAIALARTLKKTLPVGWQTIGFDPRRVELDATGLLARLGDVSALESRIKLLEQSQDLYEDQTQLLAQAQVQLAALLDKKDLPRAILEMKRALEYAQALLKDGKLLSKAVFETLVNALSHGILHAEATASQDPALIRELVEKTIQGYQDQKISQPFLRYQKRKLELLWTAYGVRVLKTAKTFVVPDAGSELEEVSPPLKAELEALERSLERS